MPSAGLNPIFIVFCISCKERDGGRVAAVASDTRTCGCPPERVPQPVILSTLTNKVYESMTVSENGFVNFGKFLGTARSCGLSENGRY